MLPPVAKTYENELTAAGRMSFEKGHFVSIVLRAETFAAVLLDP
jgi:hypothetical protein